MSEARLHRESSDAGIAVRPLSRPHIAHQTGDYY